MQYFSIEITDLAEKDLEDIGDYIAYELHSPQAALDSRVWLYRTFNLD